MSSPAVPATVLWGEDEWDHRPCFQLLINETAPMFWKLENLETGELRFRLGGLDKASLSLLATQTAIGCRLV